MVTRKEMELLLFYFIYRLFRCTYLVQEMCHSDGFAFAQNSELLMSAYSAIKFGQAEPCHEKDLLFNSKYFYFG